MLFIGIYVYHDYNIIINTVYGRPIRFKPRAQPNPKDPASTRHTVTPLSPNRTHTYVVIDTLSSV